MALALPTAASAATGALSYQGCIASNSLATGCTQLAGSAANGLNTALDTATAVAVSADGKSVYLAATTGDALVRFDRDAATGALGYQGCISSNSSITACTLISGASAGGGNTGLDSLQAVAVSADGRSVYTASGNGDAVARFDRDPVSGSLSYQGCLSANSAVTGCTAIPGAVAGGSNTGLDSPATVAVSADGESVYTGATGTDALARFDRIPASGALNYQDCISSNSNVTGCTLIPGSAAFGTDTGLDHMNSVAVSADGESVYTASVNGDAVASFDRSPVTGAVAYQSCISSDSEITSCTAAPGAAANGSDTGLSFVRSVTVSADGESVYSASDFGDAVASFDRNPASGGLVYQGCISSNSSVTGCTAIPGATADGSNTGLNDLWLVEISADGRSVYTAGSVPGAVARFDRDPAGGALSYQGCFSSGTSVTGCTAISGATADGSNAGLSVARSVAVSPDGRSVYAAVGGGDAVARFDREPEPPPTAPSNQFSFGKLKRDKRKGTAKLTVEVPGPGELVLAGKNLKGAQKQATAAGPVKLSVKAKGKGKKKLRKRGKLKLKAEVTYTPTGGSANTRQKKLKLIRRR